MFLKVVDKYVSTLPFNKYPPLFIPLWWNILSHLWTNDCVSWFSWVQSHRGQFLHSTVHWWIINSGIKMPIQAISFSIYGMLTNDWLSYCPINIISCLKWVGAFHSSWRSWVKTWCTTLETATKLTKTFFSKKAK